MLRIEEEEEWLRENVRWIENKVQGTPGMGCKKMCGEHRKRKNGSGEKMWRTEKEEELFQGKEWWTEETAEWVAGNSEVDRRSRRMVWWLHRRKEVEEWWLKRKRELA